jgi:hypothetical protein
VLSAARDISDAEYQERVWVRGEGPEVNSIAETYCRLFDDFQFDEFLALFKMEELITEEQLTVLRNFRKQFSRFEYDEDLPDEEIIKDPRWQEIRKIAKEALSKISAWQ